MSKPVFDTSEQIMLSIIIGIVLMLIAAMVYIFNIDPEFVIDQFDLIAL
jgi:hypothetical protein